MAARHLGGMQGLFPGGGMCPQLRGWGVLGGCGLGAHLEELGWKVSDASSLPECPL